MFYKNDVEVTDIKQQLYAINSEIKKKKLLEHKK